ncbi:DUF948 domain-containing protein [Paenibacillus sp. HB172176]|uniref:DUF948 domain-containing protein n=1 Tax=Paenibacillus sp. HB172176 TaxID=2493690 RepID=UPI00143B3206|nr:DUF948 domain-containing protein [Paenibacillus sp. HB172176]
MDIVIGCSVAAVAIALIFILITLNKTLKQAGAALEEAKFTMGELRGEISKITKEATEVVRQTQEVAVDTREKLNELDSLFHSINDIGHAVQSLTAAARQAAAGAADKLKSVVETRLESIDKAAAPSLEEVEAVDTPGARYSGPSNDRRTKNMISAISDGITSSIRIWNKVRVK